MCSRSVPDIHGLLSRELLAEWLRCNLSHGELSAEVERLFGEKGPAMPRVLKRDLAYFLQDRPARDLARCLAMNEPLDRREDFVEWCRRMQTERVDPYRRFGVRREDFCAERGPGHAARE